MKYLVHYPCPLTRERQLGALGRDCERQRTETVGNEEGISRKPKQRFPSEATSQPEIPWGLPLPISKLKINSWESSPKAREERWPSVRSPELRGSEWGWEGFFFKAVENNKMKLILNFELTLCPSPQSRSSHLLGNRRGLVKCRLEVHLASLLYL